eukprot:UN27061
MLPSGLISSLYSNTATIDINGIKTACDIKRLVDRDSYVKVLEILKVKMEENLENRNIGADLRPSLTSTSRHPSFLDTLRNEKGQTDLTEKKRTAEMTRLSLREILSEKEEESTSESELSALEVDINRDGPSDMQSNVGTNNPEPKSDKD